VELFTSRTLSGTTSPAASDIPQVTPGAFLHGTTTAVAAVVVAFNNAMQPADVPVVGIVKPSV
jgi:hypothetical protein